MDTNHRNDGEDMKTIQEQIDAKKWEINAWLENFKAVSETLYRKGCNFVGSADEKVSLRYFQELFLEENIISNELFNLCKLGQEFAKLQKQAEKPENKVIMFPEIPKKDGENGDN